MSVDEIPIGIDPRRIPGRDAVPLQMIVPRLARRTPIGVDVGDDAVRMIQLDARTHRIRSAAVLSRHEGLDRGRQDFVQRLKKACRRSGFRGSTCVVGAPRAVINVHPIRMPEMPGKELQESLAWEASERFMIPRDHLHVDGMRTGARYSGTDGERSEVVLFAMDDRLVAPWLEALLDAGLAPIALEPGFCGVARTHSRRYRREQDRSRVHVVFDIGAGGSTLLYLRGDRIGFCKTFSVGGNAFDEAIQERLGLSRSDAITLRRDRCRATRDDRSINETVEAGAIDATNPLLHELASEVALCLRHCAVAFRGTRPEQFVLSGRDAFEPGLASTIQERAGVEVALEDENSTMGLLGEQLERLGLSDEQPSAWTGAMGLALRSVRIRSGLVGKAA